MNNIDAYKFLAPFEKSLDEKNKTLVKEIYKKNPKFVYECFAKLAELNKLISEQYEITSSWPVIQYNDEDSKEGRQAKRIAQIVNADVIIVGEKHDSFTHHKNLAKIVKLISDVWKDFIFLYEGHQKLGEGSLTYLPKDGFKTYNEATSWDLPDPVPFRTRLKNYTKLVLRMQGWSKKNDDTQYPYYELQIFKMLLSDPKLQDQVNLTTNVKIVDSFSQDLNLIEDFYSQGTNGIYARTYRQQIKLDLTKNLIYLVGFIINKRIKSLDADQIILIPLRDARMFQVIRKYLDQGSPKVIVNAGDNHCFSEYNDQWRNVNCPSYKLTQSQTNHLILKTKNKKRNRTNGFSLNANSINSFFINNRSMPSQEVEMTILNDSKHHAPSVYMKVISNEYKKASEFQLTESEGIICTRVQMCIVTTLDLIKWILYIEESNNVFVQGMCVQEFYSKLLTNDYLDSSLTCALQDAKNKLKTSLNAVGSMDVFKSATRTEPVYLSMGSSKEVLENQADFLKELAQIVSMLIQKINRAEHTENEKQLEMSANFAAAVSHSLNEPSEKPKDTPYHLNKVVSSSIKPKLVNVHPNVQVLLSSAREEVWQFHLKQWLEFYRSIGPLNLLVNYKAIQNERINLANNWQEPSHARNLRSFASASGDKETDCFSDSDEDMEPINIVGSDEEN